MKDELPQKLDEKEIVKRYIKSIDKGLLKVMSKMGISTYQSYCGAQIFDAVGLKSDFVAEYFTGTATRIEGVGARRDRRGGGAPPPRRLRRRADLPHHARRRRRIRVPRARRGPRLERRRRSRRCSTRCAATRYEQYRHTPGIINEQSERLLTIRGLFRIKSRGGRRPHSRCRSRRSSRRRTSCKRFSTGAMSFGSISREAHTTLAIAMNRIGGKSNTGEGGEEADRFKPLPNGDSMRSAIKQVASGRFGVTAEYLVNSDMMQIKMAQGAKPGEGGQLPGHKVDKTIAKVRHSTPGVGLISPPPHHDIYSIEDLAQLIFDLKNVNPDGLTSRSSSSPKSASARSRPASRRRAPTTSPSPASRAAPAPRRSPRSSTPARPWEIGLAETHQTLVANRLRGRIAVQVDGGIRTGRDVVVGALLGADEFGFATAPLIAAGCIMMRKCHLNTCPVGVATQDPVLRKRFSGQPEHVINYFFFVAEEVRELMAAMGYRTFDEMIGQMQMLDARQLVEHWKARGPRLLAAVHQAGRAGRRRDLPLRGAGPQDPRHPRPQADRAGAGRARARRAGAHRAADHATPTAPPAPCCRARSPSATATPACRTTPSTCKFTGTAGQSFGAWLARGVTFELDGDANDYVGKGLSGGRIIDPAAAPMPASCRRNRSSSATPCSTARSKASAISAASPASASRCAIPAPSP